MLVSEEYRLLVDEQRGVVQIDPTSLPFTRYASTVNKQSDRLTVWLQVD